MTYSIGAPPAFSGADEANILLVDGDETGYEHLIEALSQSGHRITALRDGDSPLFEFGIHLPDLVILSIPLDGENRWDTLRQLREYSSVPIIALTSAEDAEVAVESLSRGADYCMTQPVALKELEARVRALIRRVEVVAGASPGIR